MMSLDVATGAIVHEMRQPLTAIAVSGAAGLNWLGRLPPSLDEARDRFKDVVEEAQRADDILKSIRGLFRNTVNQALISIEDIVEQVLRLLQHDLQTNGVFVQRDYASGHLHVLADQVQLQQVVLNLVKNAIDAMVAPRSPIKRVQVTTRYHDNLVILEINDSGPGIPGTVRDRIFDPFFTTKQNGMGLGLSICRQIIEAHGGSLVLAKNGHVGTSFQIELPIAKALSQ
jgi:C4-dicarboxylate-specific signal transduction histidine kinase